VASIDGMRFENADGTFRSGGASKRVNRLQKRIEQLVADNDGMAALTAARRVGEIAGMKRFAPTASSRSTPGLLLCRLQSEDTEVAVQLFSRGGHRTG